MSNELLSETKTSFTSNDIFLNQQNNRFSVIFNQTIISSTHSQLTSEFALPDVSISWVSEDNFSEFSSAQVSSAAGWRARVAISLLQWHEIVKISSLKTQLDCLIFIFIPQMNFYSLKIVTERAFLSRGVWIINMTFAERARYFIRGSKPSDERAGAKKNNENELEIWSHVTSVVSLHLFLFA